MFSVNTMNGGLFAYALELRTGAIIGTAANMVVEVASATRLPLVVSDYESLPPEDKGDRVAAHVSILYRARSMLGALIDWMSPEVALHQLRKEP